MSDKPKRKDTTHISGLFTIGFEDLETGGLPGITQLLTPAAMKQKALDRAKAEQDARDLARAEADAAPSTPSSATPPTHKPIAKFSVTEALEIPQKKEVSITDLSFDADEEMAAGTLEAKEANKGVTKSPPPKAPPAMKKPQPMPPQTVVPPPVRPISELTALIRRDITQSSIELKPPSSESAQGKPQGKPQAKPQPRTPAPPPPSELTLLINSGKLTQGKPKKITSLEPSELLEPSDRPESTYSPEPESSSVQISQQNTQSMEPGLKTDLHEPPSMHSHAPKPQTVLPENPQSLSDFGVQYELHFEAERGMFRYARMKGHKKAVFALWQQKFYFQMKLDLKALGLEAPFQEFAKERDEFYADAFGLIEAHYVQIVRLETAPTKVFVLLSDLSLVDYQSQIKDLLMGKKLNSGVPDDGSGDDDFVIELVS